MENANQGHRCQFFSVCSEMTRDQTTDFPHWDQRLYHYLGHQGGLLYVDVQCLDQRLYHYLGQQGGLLYVDVQCLDK